MLSEQYCIFVVFPSRFPPEEVDNDIINKTKTLKNSVFNDFADSINVFDPKRRQKKNNVERYRLNERNCLYCTWHSHRNIIIQPAFLAKFEAKKKTETKTIWEQSQIFEIVAVVRCTTTHFI